MADLKDQFPLYLIPDIHQGEVKLRSHRILRATFKSKHQRSETAANPKQKEVLGRGADNSVGLKEAHTAAEDYQRQTACVGEQAPNLSVVPGLSFSAKSAIEA